jgi:hypothetical protein
MEQSGQEMLAQMQAEREAVEKRFDELQEKLKSYGAHGYSAGSEVKVSGHLYADFLNTVNVIKITIEQMMQACNYMMDYTAGMTIRLMEVHVQHIESGEAVPVEQIEKEDAEKRIQEVEK